MILMPARLGWGGMLLMLEHQMQPENIGWWGLSRQSKTCMGPTVLAGHLPAEHRCHRLVVGVDGSVELENPRLSVLAHGSHRVWSRISPVGYQKVGTSILS